MRWMILLLLMLGFFVEAQGKRTELVETISGDFWSVNSLDFSPKGDWLAMGGTHRTLQLYSLEGQQQRESFPVSSWVVNSVVFSPDGSLLASGNGDSLVQVWSVTSKELLFTFRGHRGSVETVVFSPDGRFLASGSSDRSVRVWSLASGESVMQFGHSGGVYSLAFSPDGNWLACGGWDKEVKLWFLPKQQLQTELSGHLSSVESVVFSADGKWLASASRDNTVRLWSLQDKECEHVLRGHTGKIYSVAFSPDGQFVISGSNDKTVKIWSASEGRLIETLTGHTDKVWTVAYGPKGKWLASGSWDKTVKIWQAGDLQKLAEADRFALLPEINFVSPDTAQYTSFASAVRIITEISNVKEDTRFELRSVARDRVIPPQKMEKQEHKWRIIWDVNSLQEGRNDFVVRASNDKGRSSKNLSVYYQGEKGVVIKQQSALFGHSRSIWSLAVTGQEDFVASSSDEGEIRIWDLARHEVTQVLHKHQDGVSSLAFDREGKLLLSGGFDQNLYLWDWRKGEVVKKWQYPGYIWAVAMSPDGKWVACAGSAEVIYLLALTDKSEDKILHGHNDCLRTLAFHPNSSLLASAGDDQTIKIWSCTQGKEVQTLVGHQDWIRSVAFSHSGELLASGGDEGMIKLWSWQSGKEIRSIQQGDRPLTAVDFSFQDQFIIGAGEDKVIEVWSTETAEKVDILLGHKDTIRAALFSAGGEILLSAGDDKIIRIWQVTQVDSFSSKSNAVFPEIKLINPKTNPHSSFTSITRVGAKVLFINGPDDVKLHFSSDISLLKTEIHRVESGFEFFWDLHLAPGENPLEIVALNNSGEVAKKLAIDYYQNRSLNIHRWQTLFGHSDYIYQVTFSPDGKYLASCGMDERVYLWSIATGRKVALKGHKGAVWSLAFSPDGRYLVSGGQDGKIIIWSVAEKEAWKTLTHHEGEVFSLSISANGKYLASGGWDETLRVWSFPEGEILWKAEKQEWPILAVAFSPDSKLIASAGDDQIIRLSTVETGREIKTLKGHQQAIWGLAFNSKGTVLASASQDKSVRLWLVDTGEEIAVLSGHQDTVTSVCFSPDDALIASSSWDETIKIWASDSGECLTTQADHANWVWKVQFAQNGQWLASGGDDARVSLWKIISDDVFRKKERLPGIVTVMPQEEILPTFAEEETVEIQATNVTENDVYFKVNNTLLAPFRVEKQPQGLLLSWEVPLEQGKNTIEICALNQRGTVGQKMMIWKSQATLEDSLIFSRSELLFRLFQEMAPENKEDNFLFSPPLTLLTLLEIYQNSEESLQEHIYNILEMNNISLFQLESASGLFQEHLAKLAPGNQMVVEFWPKKQQGSLQAWTSKISFKGSWLFPFAPDNSMQRTFFNLDGSKQQLTFYSQLGYYLYYHNHTFQAVAIPLQGEDLYLYLIVPHAEKNWQDFWQHIRANNWEFWLENFSPAVGQLVLPKLQWQKQQQYPQLLKRLATPYYQNGRLEEAISVLPDFKMNYSSEFQITNGQEKFAWNPSYLGKPKSLETFQLLVNRPFFYAIEDHKTNIILLMGTVTHMDEQQ